jgi:membrane protease YdiL (CAAX protease family)
MLSLPSKYRNPWVQLLIFILFALGVFMSLGTAGMYVVAKLNHVSLDEALNVADGAMKGTAARNIMAGMQVVQFLTLFIIPSILFAYWADPKSIFPFAGLKKPWSIRYYVLAGGLILASLFAVGFLGYLNEKIPLSDSLMELEKKQNAAIGTLVTAQSVGELIFSIVLIGVLAGVGEELFFRGCLQRIVIQITQSPWLGIIITAALFSAFHLQFSGFLPRMFLGVALGALYWYSGSLWPGILFHIVYNSIGVLVAYYYPKSINNPEAIPTSEAGIYILGILGIAAIVYLVNEMKRQSKTEYAEVYPAKPRNPFDQVN